MTQTLIEQLTEWLNGTREAFMISPAAESDLRAIIEQHKRESVEAPVEYQIKILGERWTHCAKHIYDPNNPNTRALYTSPQPSHTKLIGELVEALSHSRKCLEIANECGAINDTLWASDYETLFDYMDSAIGKAREVIKHV